MDLQNSLIIFSIQTALLPHILNSNNKFQNFPSLVSNLFRKLNKFVGEKNKTKTHFSHFC